MCTNLLNSGAEWLRSQLKSHASETVTYRRGSSSVEVRATISSTPFEVLDSSGVLVTVQVRTFTMTPADLDFGDGPIEPQEGDTISEVAGGTTYTYQVMPPGPGTKAVTQDAARSYWRCHTKRVKTPA